MKVKNCLHYVIILACPILTYLFSAPDGLSVIGWHLIGIYIGTIIAIILKPFPQPVVLLTAVAVSGIIIANTPAQVMADGSIIHLSQKAVLDGYKSGTTWLVFAAFTLSTAFVTTGLGKRIAYKLIGSLGHTSLRLGYVNALLDLIISPAMPSITARGAGIMMPIMDSIAVTLGSTPKNHPKRIGQYLMVNTYMVVKTTGYITFTAMATNAVALEFLKPILHFDLTWTQWFMAACAPGFASLIIIPFVTYILNKPELKEIDNKTIARDGLAAMGAMTKAEKSLLVIFFIAILSWMFGAALNLKSSTVAIAIMPLLVMTSVVTWDDLLAKKSAWSTLIWYGGLLGLASVLKQAQFFIWLSDVMGQIINVGDGHQTFVTILILVLSVAVRYFFASGGAYTASMFPVFAAVGVAAGANPYDLGLGLLITNCFGGALTHYGSGPAAPIFGQGYNDMKSWWITGGIVAIISLLMIIFIGFPWWSLLEGMGVL